MSRFDYVKYDDEACDRQRVYKAEVESLEKCIEVLKPGRYKSLAITALEECHSWIDKALRDEQILRNGAAELQEGRTNS